MIFSGIDVSFDEININAENGKIINDKIKQKYKVMIDITNDVKKHAIHINFVQVLKLALKMLCIQSEHS